MLVDAVGGVATGVRDAMWTAPAVAVGITGFVVAATPPRSAAPRKPQERDDHDDGLDGAVADERHDRSVYGHLPLAEGIVMAGIGIEDLVLHPGCGAAIARRVGPRRWPRAVPRRLGGVPRRQPRLVGAIRPWPTVTIPVVPAAADVPP